MYLILTLKLESYVINNVIRFNFRLKSFTCSTICRKTGKSYFTVMSHTNCYILTRTHITCVCLHINSHAYFVDCIWLRPWEKGLVAFFTKQRNDVTNILTLIHDVVRKVESIKRVIFIASSIFYHVFINSTRYFGLTL